MPFSIKLSPKLVIGILITFFFAVAMFIRIYYAYDQVFVGDWIKYTGNDAYYQMRLVDNMAFNFPHITSWDPYLIFPTGNAYGGIHFFNYLLAFIIWICTAGHPTAHAVDIIGVYFPVVLAALTVIPVYFIGKELFNRWAGVIAAGIMAVMPGEFLGRSILGGTDQHVAETLFIAMAVMFTIFAVKSGWKNHLSWEHIVKRNWKAIRKPLIFSLLAGLFMGIYLLTWMGALLFVFIFAIYLVIQFILDHLKGQSTFYLAFTAFFISLAGLLVFLPEIGKNTQTTSLIVLMIFPLILALLSWFMARQKLNRYIYPAALVVLGGAFVLVYWRINPTMLHTMMNQFASVFFPGGASGATTIEMQPFLSPNGSFNIAVAWGNFTTSIFLSSAVPIPGIAIISFVLLVVLFIKNRGEEKHMLLFFVWSLIILIATLAQRRFAYYLVLNMSLLTSYLCWQGIRWFSKRQYHLDIPETSREQYKRSALVGIIGGTILFGLSFIWTQVMYFFIPIFILGLLSVFYGFWAWVRLKNKNEYLILWAFIFPIGALVLALSKDESVKNRTIKKAKDQTLVMLKEKSNPWLYYLNVITLVLLVFMAVGWPNWVKGVGTETNPGVARVATYAPSDGWEEAMHWLKDNTPDPMPAGSYYSLYNVPEGGSFVYPDTAYAVTTWWDYGYWITRTAHRFPSDNPSQSAEPIKKVAHLLLSTDQQQEQNLVKELDSSYIILDQTMIISKLWAIATWAGQESDAYTSVFYTTADNNQVQPVEVYNIEYYNLLCVRLFNFDGKASTIERPMVLTWQEKTTTTGIRIRLVTDAQEFNSYQAALQYVKSNPTKNLFICGSSPFVNPIPIEAVTDYKPVFNSKMQTNNSENTTTSSVKIFQYIGVK